MLKSSEKNPKSAGSISKRNSEEASTAKPLGNPLPGDKYFGFDPAIWFYEIEDEDKIE